MRFSEEKDEEEKKEERTDHARNQFCHISILVLLSSHMDVPYPVQAVVESTEGERKNTVVLVLHLFFKATRSSQKSGPCKEHLVEEKVGPFLFLTHKPDKTYP